LVGRGRAAELLLRGRVVTAEEAVQIGLVQFVAESAKLLAEAEAIVREILVQSSVAVSLSWEALHRGLNMTLEESTALGTDYFGLVAASEDFRIGTKAFLEKKNPSFTGR
jgi:enoyl-CoA hydratase